MSYASKEDEVNNVLFSSPGVKLNPLLACVVVYQPWLPSFRPTNSSPSTSLATRLLLRTLARRPSLRLRKPLSRRTIPQTHSSCFLCRLSTFTILPWRSLPKNPRTTSSLSTTHPWLSLQDPNPLRLTRLRAEVDRPVQRTRDLEGARPPASSSAIGRSKRKGAKKSTRK